MHLKVLRQQGEKVAGYARHRRVAGVVAGVAAGLSACGFPDRAPAIAGDPRACPGANVALEDATKHFGITVPKGASGIRYYSDLNPLFGEYGLRLVFTLGSDSLKGFLVDNGFPVPKRADPTVVTASDCPALPERVKPPMSSELQNPDGATVALWVVGRTTGRVTVAIEALDL